MKMDRVSGSTAPVLRRLLGPPLAEEAAEGDMAFLLLNPGTVSTRLAVYRGLEQVHRGEIHLSPDEEDGIEYRIRAVVSHLENAGIDLGALDGIACQGGIFAAHSQRHLPGGAGNGAGIWWSGP